MLAREDCVQIGEVSKTHNLQGSVVISTDNSLLEKYVDQPVFLQIEGAPVPFFIAEGGLCLRNATSYIVKFDYVDSLEQAEHLVGCEVLLERALLKDEEDGEPGDEVSWIGFRVSDRNSGEIGKITDVADYSGNLVLTVFISGKEILLPFSDEVICEVDAAHKNIQVCIPRELAELN